MLRFLFFFLRFHLFIFKEGRKRGRDTSKCGCLSSAPYWVRGLQPQARAPTGNLTGDPLVCSPVLNPLSHTSRARKNFWGHLLFQAQCAGGPENKELVHQTWSDTADFLRKNIKEANLYSCLVEDHPTCD